MTRTKMIVVLFFLIVLMSGTAGAEIYKWVDDKGQVHFSDRSPHDEKVKGDVSVLSMPRSRPQSIIDYGGSGNNTEPEERIEPKTPEVELYTTSWCGYCKKARNFLKARNIPFMEYDIEKDEAAARRKMKLDGRRGVPFAVINGQKVHGFSKATYKRMLGIKH